MQVTRVELRLSQFGSTVAQGTIEFNGALVVGFKLIKGEKGAFVKLGESNKGKDGKWYNSTYITNAEVREMINQEIIKKYNETLQGSQLEEQGA